MNVAAQPGRSWRWARRLTQCLAVVAVVAGPLLGGWQRLDRAAMASWERPGAELPLAVRDRLPLGRAPSAAYEVNQLMGGGIAVEYFSMPLVDPVAGGVALLASPVTPWALFALGLPLLLALVAGRVFCGWFCPFGMLARNLDRLLDRLPWRPPRLEVPRRRWVRWGLLAAVLVLSLFGVHELLFLVLPHLLVQQSVYAAWLLGGGSVVLAILLGLVVAGIAFGPTLYCSAICPTGALLSAAGHARVVRLRIVSPTACGTRCGLCDRGCWLSLQPASGDPGPDCDLCARCLDSCPRTNLAVGLGRRARKHGVEKTAAAVLALALAQGLVATPASGQPTYERASIVLRGERTVDDVTVAVTIVDVSGVRLDPDDPHEQTGVEVTAFVARGALGVPDERGHIASREVYRGPLELVLHANRRVRVRFEEPSSPVSTPERTIYRRHLDLVFEPGDRVSVQPMAGWLDAPMTWTTPDPGVSSDLGTTLGLGAAATLFFMGLSSLALVRLRTV